MVSLDERKAILKNQKLKTLIDLFGIMAAGVLVIILASVTVGISSPVSGAVSFLMGIAGAFVGMFISESMKPIEAQYEKLSNELNEINKYRR
jgi:xanthosine utilization system XapX-like protein